MNAGPDVEAAARIEAVYRLESRRVLATLIRLLGDFDLAEEALQDAFLAAAEQWPRDGLPGQPSSLAGVDGPVQGHRSTPSAGPVRRRPDGAGRPASRTASRTTCTSSDDTHRGRPACGSSSSAVTQRCPPDAQVAMALREVCGLTTEEIARAFLTGAPTVAQRIVRAKARIRAERIPYEVPSATGAGWPPGHGAARHLSRLHRGLRGLGGRSRSRAPTSSDEAIRLGRLLVELLPETEAHGPAGADAVPGQPAHWRGPRQTGDLVLLADQDRRLWDRQRIAEGVSLLARAVASGRVGPFTLQAAIAEAHATAAARRRYRLGPGRRAL